LQKKKSISALLFSIPKPPPCISLIIAILWRGCNQSFIIFITAFLHSAQDKLGIPKFSVHKLRHYFASKMSALNIPDADIMKMGGWETDHIMKSVYRHSTMDREEDAKRKAAEKLRNSIFI